MEKGASIRDLDYAYWHGHLECSDARDMTLPLKKKGKKKSETEGSPQGSPAPEPADGHSTVEAPESEQMPSVQLQHSGVIGSDLSDGSVASAAHAKRAIESPTAPRKPRKVFRLI